MSEIVYVFANPAMPDYIKVGRTSRADLEKRLKELSNHTGVPAPFVCLYAAEVDDAQKVEKALHDAFDCDRPNKKREFFTTEPNRIITLLEAFAISPDESISVQKVLDETTTPEEKLTQQAFVAVINERRSDLRFSAIGIPPGSELVFVKDETKKCKVIDDRRVEYDGETFTLSRLAMMLLHSPTLVHGQRLFTYDGERLTDRRDRLESQDEI